MGTRLVVMAALVLLVAGCGGNGELPVGEAPAPGPPVWVEPNCPADAANGPISGAGEVKRGAVPGDFVTVSVMRCRPGFKQVPGQGEWTTAIAEKADTSAGDLVAQLRQPSAPSTDGACTMEFITSPYIMLINAEGKAVLPEIPKDPCGKPKIEVRNAADALPYKLVSETPVHQSQSQLSLETGCPDSWKDLLAIDGLSYKPGPAAKIWPGPAQVRVCVYQSVSDAGKLVSGRSVPVEQLPALDSAGPAAPCKARHTGFATLASENRDAWIELDGCHRMIRPDQSLGQLDAATVATLTK